MDPTEAARIVALDFLHTEGNLPGLIALQFLGIVNQDALHAAFPEELVAPDPVELLLAAAPALPPPPTRRTYEVVAERERQYPPYLGQRPPHPSTRAVSPIDVTITHWATRARPSPEQAAQARSDFARWVEGEVAYRPGIAGSVD